MRSNSKRTLFEREDESFDLMQGQAYPNDIKSALATSEGQMLLLAVWLDRGEFAEVAEVGSQLSIDAKTRWEYQQQAYDWVQQIA